jgi:hypothetical protein
MLTLWGPRRHFCDQVSRRDFLRVGALGFGGITLADVLRLRAQGGPRPSPRSVIMVWLAGGPSHIDMYDLKPDAPAEFRGEFKPIQTNVPGFDICELMPLQTKIADKLALVRSLQFKEPNHLPDEIYTGFLPVAQRPPLGSVISRFRGGPKDLPAYVSLGKRVYGTAGGNIAESEKPYSLGAAHGPLYVESMDSAQGKLENDVAVRNLGRRAHISAERLHDRQQLLEALDSQRRGLDARNKAGDTDAFTARAFDFLTSPRAQQAFDLEREPSHVRQRYGPQLFSWGKKLLMALRLVEAGVPVVTLQAGGWDTHYGNFTALRKLLPALDQAIHALVTDLHERGLDKEVLVVIMGEMGRTPKIASAQAGLGSGRHHWPEVGFALFAGAVRTGQVIGATDSRAERPKTRALRPQNVLATIYHALGIDPKKEISDMFGRPTPLLDDGESITELTG